VKYFSKKKIKKREMNNQEKINTANRNWRNKWKIVQKGKGGRNRVNTSRNVNKAPIKNPNNS